MHVTLHYSGNWLGVGRDVLEYFKANIVSNIYVSGAKDSIMFSFQP